MEKAKKPKRRLIVTILCLVLCVLLIVADIICYQPGMYRTITEYLTGGLNVTSLEDKESSYVNAAAVSAEIANEGMVLLKNQGNVLPLTGVDKINLFGYSSAHLYLSGCGSGGAPAADNEHAVYTLKDSFEQVGISVNEELYNKYLNWQERDDQATTKAFVIQEPEITDSEFYTEELWQSYVDYSDTAAVVFSRTCVEGDDLQHGYLNLTENEEALLEEIMNRFDKVFVLIESGNMLELGFLDDARIDGAMLLNYSGNEGILSVGRIMTGEVTPSGKTADIVAYKHESAPSYYRAGMEATRQYTDIELEEDGQGYYYVDYSESIYVGYRYFETAAADGYIDYNATVQYPFGYGLSYTTFSQEIISVTPAADSVLGTGAADTITVEVKVTNTGDVAGKDVVQLYSTPPYYMGGIEKAEVNLVNFAKTSELQPGASETVTLTVENIDLASYDYNDANQNGHTGYELEAGSYTLSIRANSHEVLDEVSFIVEDTLFFDNDTTTGTEIVNLFDDAAGQGESEPVTYLSRSDWAGTWPEDDGLGDSYYRDTDLSQINDQIVDGRAASDLVRQNTAAYYQAHAMDNDDTSVGTPITGAKNGLDITDMDGLAYDDPQWDKLLDQLTVDEMVSLVSQGGMGISAVDSIGMGQLSAKDGPTGITASYAYNGGSSSLSCYGYPNETMLACTWNADLGTAMGQAAGKEAAATGVSIWYAPATNIHRSPYSGRNYEYYSEDGVLSGKMCASVIRGCNDENLITELKHFALNEQETCRFNHGLFNWCNEQAMREVFLKGFELAVKEGDANAVMVAVTRIGAEWPGASKALLTDLLTEEWGFDGFIETDAYTSGMFVPDLYMDFEMGLRAGVDTWLSIIGSNTPDLDTNTNVQLQLMRKACHDILFQIVQYNCVQVDGGTPVWSICLITANVTVFVISAVTLYYLYLIKGKKKTVIQVA